MPIKLRILLFVFVLELCGYGLLLAYNARYTGHALRELRTQQIEATFNGNRNKIDAQTDLIERTALGLATTGESFRRLKQAQPERDFSAEVSEHLVREFSRFPF